MKLFFIFVSLGVVVGEFSSEWTLWKKLHGKRYGSFQIEELRFKMFKENRIKIQKHNAEAQNGLHTYTLAMNTFGDLLQSEFLQGYTGLAQGSFSGEHTVILDNSVPVPSYVNWTKNGAVTAVKKSTYCGSCWAFSTTGSVEGQYFIKNKKLLSFKKGIYIDNYCSSTNVDLAVLVVGYGTDKASGLDYWLVKNSWGTSWGDQGYIKMARNHKNMCGIATLASYPLI
ncbi:CTSL [Lepeophtheirus salmonis]|uniref:CTSL n=1 Tax=Lepeophtheirus salmonis TaxID=72036 RepID=A0A7R8H1H5_LEPSM|nr:CTSL [Lepeophtheirus salmonis]CAF2811634.1 CTSL [Lepeophtheirus salmonis]